MPTGSAQGCYWDQANFRLVDSLNAEMWMRSPALQCEIQPPRDLVEAGKFGPQQAMLESDTARAPDMVLPWVPDIVGTKADGHRAVLIFGSAYAGFIREYSCRRACMQLSEYVEAATNGNWTAFQRTYLEKVVATDFDYYGRLACLLASAGVSPSQIVLSDLCPNSLVERGTIIGNCRRDTSRQPCKERAQYFCKYAEHETVVGWTGRRIRETRATRVVALGHIAEHGLLRLLIRHGATISCNGRPWIPPRENLGSPKWVDRYADSSKKLGYWLTLGRYWTISVWGREIRLLPIYHPSTAENYDRGYKNTCKALSAFRDRGQSIDVTGGNT